MGIFDILSLLGSPEKSVFGLPEKTNKDSSTNEILVQKVQDILTSVLDNKIKNTEEEKMEDNSTTEEENLIEGLKSVEQKCYGGALYDESMITDPGRGHWDLDEDMVSNGKTCWKRDPKKDIRKGVIGIDFGTKSTIVFYQDEHSNSMPLAVGNFNDNGQDRYENPTVMEFLSLESFQKAYQTFDRKCGRPKTDWNDLKVSWTAKNRFDEASDDAFRSFLSNLKQWASGKEKDLSIWDSKDRNLYKYKSYLDLKGDKDLDPIEVYAYFIGRNVNNMTLGIHLEYYLSMPVKFDNDVRERLRKSFENGLKKSLPTSILKDEKLMSQFKVISEITEPLAYAATALQEYEIEPSENECYAIFDMGGGTLDYDFGKWEDPAPEDADRYDYKISSFGGDGMAQMGGENLLMDFATEVFKLNFNEIYNAEKGRRIPFQLGPTSKPFEGCDRCVEDSNSIEARKNMYTLIEGYNGRHGLRYYWQNADVLKEASDSDSYSFKDLQFLNKMTGSDPQKVKVDIKVTKAQIEDFFKGKIEEAVDNFFAAMTSYEEENSGDDLLEDNSGWSKVRIFLAGNSCKSPYVKEILEEKISSYDDKYEIFPPLGTADAEKKMEELGIKLAEGYHPTGKTGVAYGLIECRRGGKIQICKEDLKKEKFEFFLGKERRKKFALWEKIPTGRLTLPEPGMKSKWVKLQSVDDGDGVVEILYTNKPQCRQGNMPKTDAKVLRCDYTSVGSNNAFYIRPCGTHAIEYGVFDETVDGKMNGNVMGKKELV